MLANVAEKRYAAEARFTNFYAGSDIVWTEDGEHFYCLNGDVVNKVNVQSSQIVASFGENASDDVDNKPKPKVADDDIDVDVDSINCFAMSSEHLVTAHRSGLLRLWELSTRKQVKLWKAQHKGPVIHLEFSPCGKIICSSGGADATLRLWDFKNNSCLCALKEFPGPAMLLRFHPNPTISEIYAVGSDNSIYAWNYSTKTLLHCMRGHISQVTGLSFQNTAADCTQIVTVGRDKVLIVWQLQDKSWSQLKVIPLFEELEGVEHIAAGALVLAACRNGKLLQLETSSWKIKELLASSDFEVTRLLNCNKAEQLTLVTSEQNMLVYAVSIDKKVASLQLVKQLVGFNDEILDMCFLGDNDRYLAIATNSKHFKLYDTEQQMNCSLISGHTDTVMSLAASHNLLLTVGKDCSIHLWKLNHEANCQLEHLMQQNNCHTATIGSVAFTHNGATGFASACQDGSMKVWQLTREKGERKSYAFSLRYAALAHDKEINCVSYALNNKILATASQDKTAKLWAADSQAMLGVLRGHTRGVWCVRFSPVDQIVLTSSSDCSLRIWSIANFSCLKRLEQECTILRCEFLDHGKFILSASSDGLLKLWNIKTNICVQSIDEHSDRVWSLAVSSSSNRCFYTGGADSKLIRFGDITDEVRNEALAERQGMLEQEQTLQSLLHDQTQLEKAFMLALTLDKPKTTYEIICHFVRKRDTAGVHQLVDQLNVDQRLSLLHHVKAWGTNSRHALIANQVLKRLLGEALLDPAQKLYNNANLVETLTPYVQRHFKRVTELQKDLAFLEFIIKSM
ncbi:transducin beta-like protein 3 [Drosophila busckii]|uniref:transducin beta-like protein 3 n=1 Tax=Drosophila busckii TaxID=30019 RepID=UPI001432F3A8|nr:transducin beta-like protein 3 [Drosophila busckii]